MPNRPAMPGSNTHGRSDALWAKVPIDQILLGDRSCGWGYHDDFIKVGDTTLEDGYIRLAGAGCSVAQIDSEANHPGIVRMSIDGNAADDEVAIQLGNGLDDGAFSFATDIGLAFEGYIRPSATTAAKWSWFFGMALGGAAGAAITDLAFVDTTGLVYGTSNLVGFQRLSAESTALDAMYQASGQTKVDGAVNTALDSVGTLAAATWIKLGFFYNPYPRTLEWFVNGAKVCSIGQAALDAAAFPDAAYFQPTFVAKDVAGDTAITLDLDWWTIAQVVCL